MTRDEFGKEFVRGMRFVIQKHDRVNEARVSMLARGSAYYEKLDQYNAAQVSLDAAIEQLADHIFDALEPRFDDARALSGNG